MENHSSAQKTTKNQPWRAILLILLVILLAVFYESKRIEKFSASSKNYFVRTLALVSAEAANNLKTIFGLNDFFGQEETFWQKIKNSPLMLDYQPEIVELELKPIPLPTETPAPPTEEIIKIQPPYQVVIIGDSFIAERFGPGLEKEFLRYQETAVFRRGIYSTGLSRPDYFNWNEEINKIIEEQNPSIIIVMFGANDAQDIKTIEGKTAAHYNSKNWNEEYGKNVSAFLEILEENKIFVFWIGNPIARDDYYRKRMANLNLVYESECAKFKNCEYVPTWKTLADANGNYADYLPDENGKLRLARASDGIHPTPFGAQILIKAVMAEIKEKIELYPLN